MDTSSKDDKISEVKFYGGPFMAIIPFIIFISGVIFIALSGAPDEKGFWPVLIISLGIGLLLSKNKKDYSEAVLDGMSERIVMVMIMAWILASIIGVLMTTTGFVEALTWLVSLVDFGSTGYIVITFILCCIVSLSTGSSFATILICGPLLYPTGGLLGAHLPTLAGAIIGGATFGDFSAPISDTTIASALSQKAQIGATVRSRIKYIAPTLVLAMIAYIVSGNMGTNTAIQETSSLSGDPAGLPMILVPIVVIWLFLRGSHLVHGLMFGLLFGFVVGLTFDLLTPQELLSLDLENFSTKSIIIDGINRAIGLTIFTILLMGLVGVVKSSGILNKFISVNDNQKLSPQKSEIKIASSVWAAVMLTTHSIVAILMVSEFTNKLGNYANISATRRANILSIVVCIFPFLLPYFIPVILMSNMTNLNQDLAVPSVSPLQVGMHNFVAWGLLIMIVIVVFLGYGRKRDSAIKEDSKINKN